MRARAETLRSVAVSSSVLFVLTILGCAYLDGATTLAVYILSFWHYYLYWLAYRYGSVPLAVFKRDAIVMKTVSIAALFWAYFAAAPDLVSLAVVAAGFSLNASAARVLGPDRTYYGHEVADLPPLQITAFPYSVVPHPMLFGNIAAFGGTLINDEFREQWWPLACIHVALNVGLLIMELGVTPGCRKANRASPAPASLPGTIALGSVMGLAGAALSAVLANMGGWHTSFWLAAAFGASIFAYAFVQYIRYSTPAATHVNRCEITLRSVS